MQLCCKQSRQSTYHSSSSLGSRCVPWLGEGLSMSSPNDPVLCCPLPYRVAPVFVQVVSPPLGWSPLMSFLVIWSPSGDARGPSVVFEAVDITLMAENPYKHHHFPGEALNQTWAADRDFQKVEKEAEEHRTKSTFPIEWLTNLKMAVCSRKPMYAASL